MQQEFDLRNCEGLLNFIAPQQERIALFSHSTTTPKDYMAEQAWI